MEDPQTGKEYIVLEMSASTLNHDVNQELCRNIGGHLPEPRNKQENLFLDSFDADTFALGINNKNAEGQWVFDWDGSPLTWMSWAKWTNYLSWPRNGHGNCVSMNCRAGNRYAGHRTQDWTNYPCESTSYIDERPKSLVCEKATGESF